MVPDNIFSAVAIKLNPVLMGIIENLKIVVNEIGNICLNELKWYYKVDTEESLIFILKNQKED